MNIKSKQFNTVIPGQTTSFSANPDLNTALREWKKYLKSNRITERLQENKEYINPSRKRNQMREKAKRRNETD